jgi:hypothetical protein
VSDIEDTGLPRATREQVQKCWEGMDKPSARKVSTALAAQGLGAAWRTILRWHKEGFKEKSLVNVRDRLNDELRASLKQLPPDQIEAANEIAKEGIAAHPDDLARITGRIKELMALTDTDLANCEAKSRRILHIVLMEEASRKGNVMILMPKDTGTLIEAFTESTRTVKIGTAIEPVNGDDAKMVGGKMIEHEPNPTADAISNFLRESESV